MFRTFTLNRFMQMCALLLVGVTFSFNGAKSDEGALWESLKSGDHFVLIRHALAPGFGDPETIDLNDCSTQRNLSEEGREQARNIGKLFRTNGITKASIMTSQWCRCRETANLMDVGNVKDMTALNSFFQRSQNRTPQLREFVQWVRTTDLSTPTVLVTHQVFISAVTNYVPSSGAIVFVRRTDSNELRVIGTIDTL